MDLREIHSSSFPVCALLLQKKFHFLLGTALAVASAAVSLVQPQLVKQNLESMDEGTVSPCKLALLVCALLSASVLTALQSFILGRAGAQVVAQFRMSISDHLLYGRASELEKFHTGDIITRLTSDCSLLQSAFNTGIVNSLAGCITIVGAMVMMATLDVYLLIVVLISVSVTVLILSLSSRLVGKYTLACQFHIGKIGEGIAWFFEGLDTIRAANAQGEARKRLGGSIKRAYGASIQLTKIGSLLGPAASLALNLCFLLVVTIGGAQVIKGELATPDLVSFVLYLFMLGLPLGSMAEAMTSLRQASGAMHRVLELGKIELEPSDGAKGTLSGEIKFNSVDFGYRNDIRILENATFTCPKNKITAIAGVSGEGKTTILSLIERFYEPSSGTIEIGGKDITQYSLVSLRDSIAFSEQAGCVFTGTVLENLRIANPDVTEQECWDVLKAVNLDKAFDSLEQDLGEGGRTLSGGQRQRLSLARVFLQDKPIWVLDEPTSALDLATEAEIVDEIVRRAVGRTVLVITHNEAVARASDAVLVVSNARVLVNSYSSGSSESADIFQ